MSSDREPKVLLRAEFDRRVRTYWLWSGIMVLGLSIIGIPLLPFWILFGLAVTERYLKKLECVLTEKSLKVGKGLLVRTEKTVPLDKITDLGLVQGPLMRALGLQALSIETAGQSSQGSLVRLVGVVDTRGFRDAVLAQRDRVMAAGSDERAAPSVAGADSDSSTDRLLEEIRDSLHRIEGSLAKEAPSAGE